MSQEKLETETNCGMTINCYIWVKNCNRGNVERYWNVESIQEEANQSENNS